MQAIKAVISCRLGACPDLYPTASLCLMGFIVIYILIQKVFFGLDVFIYTKSNKINPFYVGSIFFKDPKYRELS